MADKLVAVEQLLRKGRVVKAGEELVDVAEDEAKQLLERGVAEVKKAAGRSKKPESDSE